MLANALLELNRIPEAEAELRLLLGQRPAVARYHVGLSKLLQRQGRLAEAEAACKAALRLTPAVGLDDTNAAYLSIVGHLGRFAARAEIRARLEQAVMQRSDAEPVDIGAFKRFAYLFPYFGFDDASHLRVLRWLGQTMAQVSAAMPLPSTEPGLPLRVGFLSGDFGEHPIGHLLCPMFEALDPGRVQSFLYSTGARHAEVSVYRQRFKTAAHQFARSKVSRAPPASTRSGPTGCIS